MSDDVHFLKNSLILEIPQHYENQQRTSISDGLDTWRDLFDPIRFCRMLEFLFFDSLIVCSFFIGFQATDLCLGDSTLLLVDLVLQNKINIG